MLIMFLYFLHLHKWHYKNVKHCLKGACSLLLCLCKLQKYNFFVVSPNLYTQAMWLRVLNYNALGMLFSDFFFCFVLGAWY